MARNTTLLTKQETVHIQAGEVTLEGNFAVPDASTGVVLFAHGSGSGRHSPRNQFVAQRLCAAGPATLLIDLLPEGEGQAERYSRHLRFDIGMLANRLEDAIEWLAGQSVTKDMRVGLFGASTGGGAAIVAAARQPGKVVAVVSRGGRPDLAGDDALKSAMCPTLLIVGGL